MTFLSKRDLFQHKCLIIIFLLSCTSNQVDTESQNKPRDTDKVMLLKKNVSGISNVLETKPETS